MARSARAIRSAIADHVCAGVRLRRCDWYYGASGSSSHLSKPLTSCTSGRPLRPRQSSVPVLARKRARHELRLIAAGRVVQVLHRRLDVGVAHPLLHAADVGLGDHPRAEGVAQVVEAQRA